MLPITQIPPTENPPGKVAEKPSIEKYSWRLSKTATAEVTIIGSEIGVKDLEMLRKYLELAKDALT